MEDKKNGFLEYLPLNNILCAVQERDGNAVLTRLLALLKCHFADLDIDLATREVLAREALFPTMIAPGLAVPHARIPGLKTPLAAVAAIPNGADFNAECPVKVMVLLLTPIDEPNLHMQLLAALARSFAKNETIDQVAGSATPNEVWEYFSGRAVKIPDFLKAADLMEKTFPVLHETDSLQEAINKFALFQVEEMPVLDAGGDLRGTLALADLLKYSLPEHLLWLEDLSPIYKFQPFSDMLKTAGDTRVADVMQEDFIRVREDIPAVQLAKLFLMHKVNRLLIVDRHDKLCGIVTLKNFSAKLFWN